MLSLALQQMMLCMGSDCMPWARIIGVPISKCSGRAEQWLAGLACMQCLFSRLCLQCLCYLLCSACSVCATYPMPIFITGCIQRLAMQIPHVALEHLQRRRCQGWAHLLQQG